MLHVQFMLLDQLLSIEEPVIQVIATESGVEPDEIIAMVNAAVKGARDRANDSDNSLAVSVEVRLSKVPVGLYFCVEAVVPFEFKVETDLDNPKYVIGGQDLFSVTICMRVEQPIVLSKLSAANAHLN